ncbi:MAG TPA: Gfo/Idh/MocA family oxidoreductase [Chthonomonadaceae bacterium]|nr:Gfo/Idh/MocA family oxidoreductase [Chthonomonadaceae bacterium]
MQSAPFEASGLPLASSPFSSAPIPPVRIGVVGCALARTRYGEALSQLASLQVAALADPDKRLARAWARQLGGSPPVFESLEPMLQAVPALEAVLIASSPHERSAQVMAAAQARRSLLVELPFADSLAETDALLRAAAENGVLLMPALSGRFDAAFRQIARYAEAGALGTLRQARCDRILPAWGASEAESRNGAADSGWNALLQRALFQTADLCRWWLGDALMVSADIDLHRQDAAGRSRGPTPALANVILTHERGQSVHHLARVRSTQSEERYKLSGALGYVELIFGPTAAMTLHRPSLPAGNLPAPEEVASPPAQDEAEALRLRARRMLSHFADCIRTACAPQARGADARAALEIVHAAYLSTQEGSKISLPLRRSLDIRAIMRSPGAAPRPLPPPNASR